MNGARWTAAPGSIAAAILAAGCVASQYRENPRVAVVDGDPIVQMVPRGKLPSATEPPMVPLARHTDPPKRDGRLLGLTFAQPPRAYPIGLLDRFEIVNDFARGVPYAVVRCALTHVAAAYERRARGRVLVFENSGALWRDTLVMRDRETGTLWSAATGAALLGPLAGERLVPVVAVYTTAQAWGAAYPASLYMDMGEPTSVPLLMRLYAASPWQGVSKIETRDTRHKPKKKFLSVAAEHEALAFTEEQIRADSPVRARLAGRPISIEWDPRLETARAYSPGRGGRREEAVVPIYWFALDRHYDTVTTVDGVNAENVYYSGAHRAAGAAAGAARKDYLSFRAAADAAAARSRFFFRSSSNRPTSRTSVEPSRLK